ncbi:MAG: DUF2867 domain-containing protein [Candidatus Cryptobacteroides sp.]
MKTERLIDGFRPVNYEDCFRAYVKAGCGVDDLFHHMFEEFPAPVRWLLKLRDALVKPFGLKTGATFREHILDRNDEEIVLGIDDKHLDFRVSLFAGEDSAMEVRTLVKYHNMLGKLYFAAIWRFHKILVSILFRRSVKAIMAVFYSAYLGKKFAQRAAMKKLLLGN